LILELKQRHIILGVVLTSQRGTYASRPSL
jgi:hypothetical protein